MKSRVKFFCIIALIVMIGFVVPALFLTGCDNGNGDQNCADCGKLTCECPTDTVCETCDEDPCECPVDCTTCISDNAQAENCTLPDTCTVCDEIITPAGSHTPGAAATCETAQTCTVYEFVIEAAIGHRFDWQEKSFGIEIETCQNTDCNETRGDIRLTLEIGDTGEAGGIIFYVAPAGFNLYQGTNNTLEEDEYTTAYYLEAWTVNETGTYRWSWANEPTTSRTYTNVTLVQQSHNTATPTQWIGYGLRNTRLVVAAMSSNPIETNRAVHIASTSKGGFNDWFLPSVDELNEMYIARAAPNNIAGLPTTTGWIWSSSQQFANSAQVQDFADGSRGPTLKDLDTSVRAVRAF